MGIDIVLESESGEVLDQVGDPQYVVSKAWESGKFSGKRLLRYLVPWGNAIFNQAQAGDLLVDVREISREHDGRPLGELFSRVEPLVDRLAAESHAYLWFKGD